MMRRLSLLLCLFLMPAPAPAGSDPASLAREAIARLEAAHVALTRAQRAPDRVAALSQTIRAYEDGLDALREGLRRAALREAAIRRSLEAERARLSRLLGVMMSLQAASGPLTTLHPSGPLGTARAGMILSEITPAIRAEAERLRAALEEVETLRRLQESAADTLRGGLADVQQARIALSQAMAERRDLPQRYIADPARLQKLIDSAETLEGFASGLAGIDPGSLPDAVRDPVRDFRAARGSLPLPVQGTVLRRYNEADAAGVKRPGMILATRPLALVTAPWAATIRFSGPFPGHGQVVILEPDADTLLVLAGLGRTFGAAGQVIPPGTPVGMMGGAPPDAEGFFQNAVNGAGSARPETLYMELRIDGRPVDPAEWFARTKD